MGTNIAAYGFEHTEDMVIMAWGWVRNALGNTVYVPRATQIHHMKKPKSKYLNDESTWMAVSSHAHRYIEDHKSEARKKGYLFDI